jgi:outer membrane protein assembly factor BamB
LDRLTGAFRLGVPFAKQNWTEGLDKRGRPIPLPASQAGVQGVSTYPGAKGATNWWSPSYDRDLDLVFIPVLEEGMVFFPSAQTLPTTGGRSFYTAIRALDASTGKLVWEHRQETRSDDDNTSGLMSTSGGVVFGADHGSFFALDSRSGNLLWTVETGGVIYAPPVTYTVEGEQFVSIISGRNLMTFALPKAVSVPTEPPALEEESGVAAMR